MYSRIVGTGSYLPERIVVNADLERLVATTDEWIRERTGIERRHVVAENETTLDLAEQAALRALQSANLGVADVDLICVGTTTPDQVFPNIACLLQQRLGVKGPPAIQVEAACAGFIYALSVADKFIRLGDAKCALVIGADTFTRLIDWSDRNTCVLFGDGAGAVVLKPSDDAGIFSTHIHANGEHAGLLFYPTGPSKRSNPAVTNETATHMRGSELFREAVNTMGDLVRETLHANRIDCAHIDWLIPHQANLRIIHAIAKKIDMPMERVIVTVQDHGNTSAASVPLALDRAVKDGRIKHGHMVLMEAFGGGLTWGSALVRM